MFLLSQENETLVSHVTSVKVTYSLDPPTVFIYASVSKTILTFLYKKNTGKSILKSLLYHNFSNKCHFQKEFKKWVVLAGRSNESGNGRNEKQIAFGDFAEIGRSRARGGGKSRPFRFNRH